MKCECELANRCRFKIKSRLTPNQGDLICVCIEFECCFSVADIAFIAYCLSVWMRIIGWKMRCTCKHMLGARHKIAYHRAKTAGIRGLWVVCLCVCVVIAS